MSQLVHHDYSPGFVDTPTSAGRTTLPFNV